MINYIGTYFSIAFLLMFAISLHTALRGERYSDLAGVIWTMVWCLLWIISVPSFVLFYMGNHLGEFIYGRKNK
ncbi:hypothetical protein JFA41_003872 [Salmonella enterica subsp. enterica serovar Poona]|nr:hypothetical protein [Salmonella enterica subsp. enterica serovar Poona]ELM0493102.1 hypothetical protein [Salmonella enterica]